MKCRKCGGRAVINMRQHKLALCAEHFTEWAADMVEKSIEKQRMFSREERVLVAVSGGKDSLALWEILLGLGYRADALYIDLGIDGGIGYSEQSGRMAEMFAESRGGRVVRLPGEAVDEEADAPTLYRLDIAAAYGETLPEVASRSARGRGKPCSVCGLIKRHEMNRVASERRYDVLATGHNLDDEAATLFGNTLGWQAGYLARQSPVLTEDEGFARKVKPLFRLYERETTAYCLVRGIEYVYDECPYAVGATSISHKEVLSSMEQKSPGTKQGFYLGFLRAREAGLFADTESSRPLMHPCERCSQPTTAPSLCAFCRLWA